MTFQLKPALKTCLENSASQRSSGIAATSAPGGGGSSSASSASLPSLRPAAMAKISSYVRIETPFRCGQDNRAVPARQGFGASS